MISSRFIVLMTKLVLTFTNPLQFSALWLCLPDRLLSGNLASTFALVLTCGRNEWLAFFSKHSASKMNDIQFKGQIQKKLYREQTQLSHLQVIVKCPF